MEFLPLGGIVDGKQTQHADGDFTASPMRDEANNVSDAEEAGRSISEVVFWENHQKNSKTSSLHGWMLNDYKNYDFHG
jgi:hypothetical protein